MNKKKVLFGLTFLAFIALIATSPAMFSIIKISESVNSIIQGKPLVVDDSDPGLQLLMELAGYDSEPDPETCGYAGEDQPRDGDD